MYLIFIVNKYQRRKSISQIRKTEAKIVKRLAWMSFHFKEKFPILDTESSHPVLCNNLRTLSLKKFDKLRDLYLEFLKSFNTYLGFLIEDNAHTRQDLREQGGIEKILFYIYTDNTLNNRPNPFPNFSEVQQKLEEVAKEIEHLKHL